ncbi:hypothetical protein N7G274_002377 [Stereocaulon virgatum]|uniref:Uncharacterized protein n=1 Tax=Stereocaulon virgatum TaxID=373712 RepID=A0ABR4AII2_9LECA
MSRSGSISTQASSSASTRPQRLKTRTPKAVMANLSTEKPLAAESGPKKRLSSEVRHTGATLSSTSIKQTSKKRKRSPQRMGASPSTTSPNDTLSESAATSSSPSVRPSPDVTNGTLRGGAATLSSPSLQQSPEPSRNAPQLTLQPSLCPQKMAEKLKSGPRIKSYDAALDKAIERADTAERRATEAERRLQESEQDGFARNYENFEGPPTHKYHSIFEKKDQLIRDLQARLERHEVTIAKKKGEVSAHVAYKKELKASLAEKNKDIKVLKARQDTLTMAIIERDADIAKTEKKIAALQQQLEDQNMTTPEETDGSKTLKTAHEECNDAAREKDAEIQSLKAMHEGCDEAMESLNAEIKSMAAQAKIDKRSLAQKDELMNIRSEKYERERNEWLKSCQTHVRILTNSQRVAEDLDAEVKQLRRTLERTKRELADATKHSGTEAASPQNELQDSQIQLTQQKLAQNLGDLQNGERKSIATSLVRLFVDQAKQTHAQGTMIVLPGQTTDAIGLRLGLLVENAMYRHFWGEAEEPNEEYLDNFNAIRLYLETYSGLRDRLLDRPLLPEALPKTSEDEILGKVMVMEAVEEQRTFTQTEDSSAEQVERIQQATQVKSDHQEDHDEHQSADNSASSEGYEAKVEKQSQEEHLAENRGIGEEGDNGVSGISSSNRPLNDSHDK